jgi:hypothetical protein
MLLGQDAPDPYWLLSTSAQCAAALVAIIGGLLASRVVTLKSERSGTERQLRLVEGELVVQRARVEALDAECWRLDRLYFMVAKASAAVWETPPGLMATDRNLRFAYRDDDDLRAFADDLVELEQVVRRQRDGAQMVHGMKFPLSATQLRNVDRDCRVIR